MVIARKVEAYQLLMDPLLPPAGSSTPAGGEDRDAPGSSDAVVEVGQLDAHCEPEPGSGSAADNSASTTDVDTGGDADSPDCCL